MSTIKTVGGRRFPSGRTSGFSLIEIMIVLAISSLLVIVVFQAFSFGQRIRRDNQRKEYLQLVAENLDKLKDSNNYAHKYPRNNTLGSDQGGNEDCPVPDDAFGHVSIFQCLFDLTYATNPAVLASYGSSYAVPGAIDPLSHTPYVFVGAWDNDPAINTPPNATTPSHIYYRNGYDCAGVIGSSPYDSGLYRIKINLEDGAVYCLDNH